MEFRKLGKSDVSVSVVAMGCWAIVGDSTWGPQEEAESIHTIHAALGAGVTLFDTAEAYGDGYSETLLGKALSDGRRRGAVIASKFNHNRGSGEDIRKACEASLARLNSDYIDLYQVHWRNRDLPLDEVMDTLQELHVEGKVRLYGVCNFGLGDLGDLLSHHFGTHAVTNQLPYSLLWRSIEFGIRQKCAENQIGILPYSPLAQGLLTGKFATPDDVADGRARTRHFSRRRTQTRHGEEGQEAETFSAIDRVRKIAQRIGQPMSDVSLAWLLAQEGVVSVLAGMRNQRQVEQNVRGAGVRLGKEVIAELSAATDDLKRRFGANSDMWESEAKTRYR